MKHALIGAGFSLFGATGLHRLTPAGLRGLGAILMFHHVRPRPAEAFRPNDLLEITPCFLDAVVGRIREQGYDIVSLDEAVARCRTGARSRRPFAVLTFDDGYRDNLDHALPVLERHGAPFTVFVTPGFADGHAHLWWTELEEAVRRSERIRLVMGGESLDLPSAAPEQKRVAFEAIYRRLRAGPEDRLRAAVADLCAKAGVGGPALTRSLCMGWDEIVALSRHPLATIGAHTLTHPRLAKLDDAAMTREIVVSRSEIETRIGRPVPHFAYPVGDPTSAGPREFAAVAAAGFASAVTTRPGLIFPEHAAYMTALPRLSVNGRWQDLRHIDVLLSGAAFAIWNRGRRVNAA